MEPRRYTLVPDADRPAAGPGPAPLLARPRGPLLRSALGVDRLERMEEIAARERANGNGQPSA